ncbi:hypothetical protein [Actinacidiphila oryziradicis]|uniref:hypothetical protein n=1 Tax=Actinacidiphila oryziradicis TaxID=2571141 RepID=UPI0023F1933A|nr:hypothetical protein [Actinacidiphila oryziradicis]MCW2869701.1 hypothetical protein [Actinacidiphila oryziradicis]
MTWPVTWADPDTELELGQLINTQLTELLKMLRKAFGVRLQEAAGRAGPASALPCRLRVAPFTLCTSHFKDST